MRWVIRIVCGLLALAVFAVLVLFLLPAERIARLATDQFQAATGRAMTLEGDVRPTLWPELGVNTGAVTIANAPWSTGGAMVQAKRLSVGVDMMALLGGEVRITRIEIEAPRVLLDITKDGRGNWQMVRENGVGATETANNEIVVAGGIPAFTMDQAIITDGTLRLVDHGAGTVTELTGIGATLQLPDFQGSADIDMQAVMNRQAFSAQIQIAEFAGFLAAGAVPATIIAKIGGNTFDFEGRAGLDPLAAGGQLDATMPDMAALFALLGQPAPDLPRGLGQTIGLSGAVTATDAGQITLRDGRVTLDQNVLTGAADVTLAARPRIVAKLNAGALDLSGLTTRQGGAGRASSSQTAAPGWSRDPLDVSGLQTFDAEVALVADSLDLGMAKLGRTSLLTRLNNGRAVTDIHQIAAYDGTFAGTLVVNSRGGLSTRATLRGTGVRLKPLLAQLASWDRLQTSGDISFDLLGVGNSIDDLMNSWSGTGAIKFGQGELSGFDLVGMLRNLDLSYIGAGAKTIFESIGATFTVESGVITNADLTFLSPLLKATGEGRVGLGAQTIDYRLVPTLLHGQTNGGIKVPVLISGTWAKPKFRLDLESLAQERLNIETDKLKLQAEEAIKAKLSEELGVTLTDTKDIDEALKLELEDRAARGLLDLLGKN